MNHGQKIFVISDSMLKYFVCNNVLFLFSYHSGDMTHVILRSFPAYRSSINYVVYCLLGKKFNQEFIMMMIKCFGRRTPSVSMWDIQTNLRWQLGAPGVYNYRSVLCSALKFFKLKLLNKWSYKLYSRHRLPRANEMNL